MFRPQWFRRIGLWMAGIIRPQDLSEENALALVVWFSHTGIPRLRDLGIAIHAKRSDSNTGQYL